ncbi:juvenile hormone esterase-like [Colletes gigas]|uniref:juvenile hormone esterase-like n=1 Tax=Colletes gigas TaxID=935657 RepID=UPI001C9B9A7A|nr:juvenile hormone esterase-like [Colletes gigas]
MSNMGNLIFIVSILLAFVSQCIGLVYTPIINTTRGPVQGEVLKTVWNGIEYCSFKGIRYAEPAIGKLRFRAPEPVKPWTSVLDATKEGSVCPQIFGDDTYIGDEDCLHLSVFTPKLDFHEDMALLPVMVWIYGGSFVKGFVNTTQFGPDFFIEQKVIVVSISYRLGALGFLYLNNPSAPGNAGMKDQAMGLQWVQDNIAMFGGDKSQVTLFGQSAGGSSVLLHHLSDKSKDLFTRSITQSGTPLYLLFSTPIEALASAHHLALNLGVDDFNTNRLFKKLVNVPAEKIVRVTNTMNLLPAVVTLPFMPTIENPKNCPENTFISECPITLVMTGKMKKCEKIFGMTSNEALAFTPSLFLVANYTAVPRELTYNLINDTAQVVSDLAAASALDLTEKLLEAKNGKHPVYYYYLTYESKYSPHRATGVPINGTAHADDNGFLFNEDDINAPTDPNDPFNVFRHECVSLWANFAKYGNPTPKNNNPIDGVIWEPAGKSGRMLKINETFEMIPRVASGKTLDIERLLYFSGPYISSCRKIDFSVSYNSIFL